MQVNKLKEAIREVINKVLDENAPAPAKPTEKPGPAVAPGKPGEKKEPNRRKIGNPNVKPAPKAMNEEEMLKKIVARFKSKKESAGGPLDFAGGKLKDKTPKEGETYLKNLKAGDKFSIGNLDYVVVKPIEGGANVSYADGTGNMNFKGDAVIKINK